MEWLKKRNYFFFLIIVFLIFILQSLAQWFISFCVEDYSIDELLNKSININIEFKTLILVIFLVILIILVFLGIIYCKYKQIQENEKKMVLGSIENWYSILYGILEKTPFIDSMHVYRASFQSDDKNIILKTKHIVGIADENVVINSVLQTYFKLPNDYYDITKEISKNYSDYKDSESEFDKLQYKTKTLQSSKKLLEEFFSVINKIKDKKFITPIHCDMYRAVTSVVQIVSEMENAEEEGITVYIEDAEIENTLLINRKNGLLPSILFDTVHLFTNNKSYFNKGRNYFSFPCTIDSERYYILASISNVECKESNSDTVNIDKRIKAKCNDLIEYIQKEFSSK